MTDNTDKLSARYPRASLKCDRSFAASAGIGYATRRARWNLGLGLRSAIML
ncbi:MAG: hypothetical protein KME06_12150 [Kastovskya adunca ATA6-11-RM4]|nr:hypothetical protein [Kastovskya adunca ATA6-11-RM4]